MVSDRDRSETLDNSGAGMPDGGGSSEDSGKSTSTTEDDVTVTSVRSALNEFAEERRPCAPFVARPFCGEGKATSETY